MRVREGGDEKVSPASLTFADRESEIGIGSSTLPDPVDVAAGPSLSLQRERALLDHFPPRSCSFVR